jgi:hypothetical protein
VLMDFPQGRLRLPQAAQAAVEAPADQARGAGAASLPEQARTGLEALAPGAEGGCHLHPRTGVEVRVEMEEEEQPLLPQLPPPPPLPPLPPLPLLPPGRRGSRRRVSCWLG